MYELHAHGHAAAPPPPRRRPAWIEIEISEILPLPSAAERGGPEPRGGGPLAYRRFVGWRRSGCLWQTPFCTLRPLPFPFPLSSVSPISVGSRQMVIAISHVARLHYCSAATSPLLVRSFFARICARAIDSDGRFSFRVGMTSSRRCAWEICQNVF